MSDVYAILGMHRSGTSLIANILHASGISMGENFLPPDELNNHGYYEDNGFLWINKGLLEHCGGSWYEPPPTRLLKMSRKFTNAFLKAFSARNSEASGRSWGWKDPRNSLTCWFFHKCAPEVRYIVVRRNKIDVVESLLNGHPTLGANWSKLYDMYESSMNSFLRKYKYDYVEVDYDEMVNRRKYMREVQKLHQFTGLGENLVDKAASIIRFRP